MVVGLVAAVAGVVVESEVVNEHEVVGMPEVEFGAGSKAAVVSRLLFMSAPDRYRDWEGTNLDLGSVGLRRLFQVGSIWMVTMVWDLRLSPAKVAVI